MINHSTTDTPQMRLQRRKRRSKMVTMNHQEIRNQKFDHLKKRASLIAKTFVLGMLGPLGPLMMGCGFVNYNGKLRDLHDYNGVLIVDEIGIGHNLEKPYDEAIHGKIIDFVEVGDPVPSIPNSKDGKVAIHVHHANNSQGPYGFEYR